METTRKTYREINQFINIATALQQQKWMQEASPLTGFKYAIGKVLKNAVKINSDYNDKCTEYNIDHASEDEKKNIMTVNGETVFTKDNSKKRNQKIQELLDTEVEISVYFAKTAPDNLTAFQYAVFEGFVLHEREESDLVADEVKEPSE